MNDEMSTNKLTIYLIKEGYLEPDQIIKNGLNSNQIENGVIYFGESHSVPPSWIKNFFCDQLLEEDKLFSASAKAIFLTEIEIKDRKKRIFAIPFGYGRTLLTPGVYEERFGLKTTLNLVESDGIRRINKKSLTSIPKDTTEQLSKEGVAADFGIDIEQDLVQAIQGKSKDKKYGKTISGKDSLTVSVKINFSNIQPFLKDCFYKYQSDEYKKDFGWIDQLSEIRDPFLVETLNNQVLDRLKNNETAGFWMAVPELIEWSEISGFAYSSNRREIHDDICLDGFLSSLRQEDRENIDLSIFDKKKVYCYSSTSGEIRYGPWKAYDCLYCEISDERENKTFLLSNGKWYQVDSDFVGQINRDYQRLRDSEPLVSLPLYQHNNENHYNRMTAKKDDNFCCMDSKNISYGGGNSKIEFCDLLTRDNKIIHVKHYANSSVLSHLFSQGIVSGELFLAEREFRRKVNSRLKESHKLTYPDQKPNPSNYDIVFAIISSSQNDLDIPFFSKVNLRNAKRRLETFGYNKVSLQKISCQKR